MDFLQYLRVIFLHYLIVMLVEPVFFVFAKKLGCLGIKNKKVLMTKPSRIHCQTLSFGTFNYFQKKLNKNIERAKHVKCLT